MGGEDVCLCVSVFDESMKSEFDVFVRCIVCLVISISIIVELVPECWVTGGSDGQPRSFLRKYTLQSLFLQHTAIVSI